MTIDDFFFFFRGIGTEVVKTSQNVDAITLPGGTGGE